MSQARLATPEVKEIIEEMMSKDHGTIAYEIQQEVKKRLGIEISLKYLNQIRNGMGYGRQYMWLGFQR